MPRHEIYQRQEDGTSRLVSVEDARTLEEARRERRTLILSIAHSAILGRLVTRGYPPDIAGPIAASLLVDELPAAERAALASIATTAINRALTRLRAVDDATTIEGVDQVDSGAE